MQDGGVSPLRSLGECVVDLRFTSTQSRMNEAPIESARTLRRRTQQPEHDDYLDLVVKWEPVKEFSFVKQGVEHYLVPHVRGGEYPSRTKLDIWD